MRFLNEDIDYEEDDEDIELGQIEANFRDRYTEAAEPATLFLTPKGKFKVDTNMDAVVTFNTINDCKNYVKDYWEPDGAIRSVTIDWEHPEFRNLIRNKNAYQLIKELSEEKEAEEEKQREKKRAEEAEKNKILSEKAKKYLSGFSRDELEKLLVDEHVIDVGGDGGIKYKFWCAEDRILGGLTEGGDYPCSAYGVDDYMIDTYNLKKEDLYYGSQYLENVFSKYSKQSRKERYIQLVELNVYNYSWGDRWDEKKYGPLS